MKTTDPDLGKCKRCGLPLSRCKCRGVAAKVVIVGVALALLAMPLQAQTIVGPGPCSSDTPWGCYEYRQHLPMLIYDDITVGDDATAEPIVVVTPTPTPTPTATATATPVAPVTVTLVIVTVAP